MSLQTAITDWRDIYDETGIGQNDPDYIGSIRDVNGVFHTGVGIYQGYTDLMVDGAPSPHQSDT
ncbi:hypothetical protein, partial [Pseudomonas aeruginosa]